MPGQWQNWIFFMFFNWNFVNSEIFPMLMPNVKPQLPKNESYLCTGTVTDPTKELYITGFEPMVTMNQAHHLMVIGCSNPSLGSTKHNLWNCGGTLGETSLDFGGSCQGGDMQVLYMWSRNASGLSFPEDSAITVGGSSSVQLLVLQVHYIDNSNIDPVNGDSSGVLVQYHSSPKPKYNVGIFSLHNHGIAKANGLSSWESACHLNIPKPELFPIIPFAFLTHTHQLGIFSGGWIIRDRKWILIGKANPQDPQSFYPVNNELEITSKDTVAMRCIMSSDRSQETYQGLSKHSEMCDYFVIYKTRGNLLSDNSCTTNSTFTWTDYGLAYDANYSESP